MIEKIFIAVIIFLIILFLNFISLVLDLFNFEIFQSNISLIKENKSKESEEYKEIKIQKMTYKNFTINISFPMLAKNLRWEKIPIKYSIDSSCKLMESEIEKAIKYWEEFIGAKIFEKGENGIYFFCKESESKIVGEAMPIFEFTGLFNIIRGCNITIYQTSKQCIKPVRIIHEIGHCLGFEHSKNQKSIMYEYEVCDSELENEIRETFWEIYKIKPYPNPFLKSVSINSDKEYLNISIEIGNNGLTSANISLIIKVGEKETKKNFEIDVNEYVNYSVSFFPRAKNVEIKIVSEKDLFLDDNEFSTSI